MKSNLTLSYYMEEKLLSDADAYISDAERHQEIIKSGSLEFTGWAEYASKLLKEEKLIREVKTIAEEIRGNTSCFITSGIGGSYLGGKAAIEFVDGGSNPTEGRLGAPRVEFAGYNLSGTWHEKLLKTIENKNEDISICQISKSGGTVEPGMAFSALRQLMIKKYGEKEADRRTYAATDPEKGSLKSEAVSRGWKTLPIPPDIGGRFTVLTPVGLLPMAVAGIDIDELLEGAASAETGDLRDAAIRLACLRYAIDRSGKDAQVISCFEPSVDYFIGWLIQLFGESEGKDGKGMIPVALSMSKDLHSMGQFLQEGSQIFSELLINIENPPGDIVIAEEAGSPFAGRNMNEYNAAVHEAVIKAHRNAGVPIIDLNVKDQSAGTLGQLIYFFELTCALTGKLMGVDPFNQPGVDSYKKEMMNILNKS